MDERIRRGIAVSLWEIGGTLIVCALALGVYRRWRTRHLRLERPDRVVGERSERGFTERGFTEPSKNGPNPANREGKKSVRKQELYWTETEPGIEAAASATGTFEVLRVRDDLYSLDEHFGPSVRIGLFNSASEAKAAAADRLERVRTGCSASGLDLPDGEDTQSGLIKGLNWTETAHGSEESVGEACTFEVERLIDYHYTLTENYGIRPSVRIGTFDSASEAKAAAADCLANGRGLPHSRGNQSGRVKDLYWTDMEDETEVAASATGTFEVGRIADNFYLLTEQFGPVKMVGCFKTTSEAKAAAAKRLKRSANGLRLPHGQDTRSGRIKHLWWTETESGLEEAAGETCNFEVKRLADDLYKLVENYAIRPSVEIGFFDTASEAKAAAADRLANRRELPHGQGDQTGRIRHLGWTRTLSGKEEATSTARTFQVMRTADGLYSLAETSGPKVTIGFFDSASEAKVAAAKYSESLGLTEPPPGKDLTSLDWTAARPGLEEADYPGGTFEVMRVADDLYSLAQDYASGPSVTIGFFDSASEAKAAAAERSGRINSGRLANGRKPPIGPGYQGGRAADLFWTETRPGLEEAASATRTFKVMQTDDGLYSLAETCGPRLTIGFFVTASEAKAAAAEYLDTYWSELDWTETRPGLEEAAGGAGTFEVTRLADDLYSLAENYATYRYRDGTDRPSITIGSFDSASEAKAAANERSERVHSAR